MSEAGATGTSDEAKRLELLAALRKEISERQLSNTEHFDKAVLSLSSAFLALSLVFLKDLVPYREAIAPPLLFLSWASFAAAIAATLLSFLFSQKGLERQLAYAEKYYAEGLDEYLNKANPYQRLVPWLAWFSGGIFLLGVIATIAFISVNIDRSSMKKSNAPAGGNWVPESVKKGATVPTMQPVKPAGGAQIPTMQGVPKAPAPPPAPTQGGGSGSGGSGQ